MSDDLVRFELHCTADISNVIQQSEDLGISIYEESEVQRDFGAFLLGIIATVAADQLSKLIDRIVNRIECAYDEDDPGEGNGHNQEEDRTTDSDPENDIGVPKAYLMLNGETYDLRIELDRADLEAVLETLTKRG